MVASRLRRAGSRLPGQGRAAPALGTGRRHARPGHIRAIPSLTCDASDRPTTALAHDLAAAGIPGGVAEANLVW